MCVGVGEALANVRRGKFGDSGDVRDGRDRRHEGEAYKLRMAEEECEEELARDEEDEPAEVRRGEERVEEVAVLSEHLVEAVESGHPRDGALERGAGVVVRRGRAGERRSVAGHSGEDALPERRQLEKRKRQERRGELDEGGSDVVLDEERLLLRDAGGSAELHQGARGSGRLCLGLREREREDFGQVGVLDKGPDGDESREPRGRRDNVLRRRLDGEEERSSLRGDGGDAGEENDPRCSTEW